MSYFIATPSIDPPTPLLLCLISAMCVTVAVPSVVPEERPVDGAMTG